MQPGSATGNSSGLSGSRKTVRLDVRTGYRRAKKGWMKFHALIDIGTVVVLEMDAARDTAGDCPAMTGILGKNKDWKWDGRSDSAACPGTFAPPEWSETGAFHQAQA